MTMLPRVSCSRCVANTLSRSREIELLKGVVARHVLVEHAARETSLLGLHDGRVPQHEADELRVEHPLHVTHLVPQRRRRGPDLQQALEHVVLDELLRLEQIAEHGHAPRARLVLRILSSRLEQGGARTFQQSQVWANRERGRARRTHQKRGVVVAAHEAVPEPFPQRLGEHALRGAVRIRRPKEESPEQNFPPPSPQRPP